MYACVRETRVVKRDDARARLHPGAAAGYVCRVANVVDGMMIDWSRCQLLLDACARAGVSGGSPIRRRKPALTLRCAPSVLSLQLRN